MLFDVIVIYDPFRETERIFYLSLKLLCSLG